MDNAKGQDLLTGQVVFHNANEAVGHIAEIRKTLESLAGDFFGVVKIEERVHKGVPSGDSWMHLINKEIVSIRNAMEDITGMLAAICNVANMSEIRDEIDKQKKC